MINTQTIGATRGLNQAVARQRDWLVKTYGREVVVRFNSDQQSGGAFIKDATTKDAGLGLCVGLIDPNTQHPKLREFLSRGRKIFFAVKIDVAYVKKHKQRLLNNQGYGYYHCVTAKEARSVLIRYLDTAVILKRGITT